MRSVVIRRILLSFAAVISTIPAASTAQATDVTDTTVAATQNSVLNMFVSAIPAMSDVKLQQVGVSNGTWIYQAIPLAEIGTTTRSNSVAIEQNGQQNNLFTLQVGRTNFAVILQHSEAPKTYYFGTDYETQLIRNGRVLRFRSGEIDIISMTPRGLTAGPSTFGRAH